ncbi:carotene biosynthesis-associated membrane protein [Psychroflexus gondwanensis ACAM 44]|jgi:putative membrane protein|uniref:Carotene biosynthesis-associated membrane protein n=1 Tax=Psychroflexus gondwanensis ACAM 44 TaxID=1189619 RepID=N1WSB2_9FLAO|nr:carotenoid biosynthesis protein [Psychroflexus gondwanensis]EMY81895.1 carotene biosynthesis-associated membrane protein [Psychroflexus gondwanensis ACAM 44]
MKSLPQQQSYLYIAIGILWLFHVSGIIGISIGYQDWFASRTGLNLVIMFIALIAFYPLDSIKKWGLFFLFGFLGILVEYLGVTFGLFFGDYAYGNNFGPKILGVPLLIGVNWAMLTFICGSIANKLSDSVFLKSLLGTFMMLLLDLFMEKVAPIFDFWEFTGGYAPIDNYIAWGVISFIFHLIFHLFKVKGNFLISFHLYMVQLVFFIYFYVYF